MVLRSPLLVSDLQHQTPPPAGSGPVIFPKFTHSYILLCFKDVPRIYYVLTLVFFDKIRSSACLCSRGKFGQSAKLAGEGGLNTKMALRIPRLVSELHHQTPSSPEAAQSFSPKFTHSYILLCFKAVPMIYYVLTLLFFDKFWSSDCLCSRGKSRQSAKLAGEVLTPRWR